PCQPGKYCAIAPANIKHFTSPGSPATDPVHEKCCKNKRQPIQVLLIRFKNNIGTNRRSLSFEKKSASVCFSDYFSPLGQQSGKSCTAEDLLFLHYTRHRIDFGL